jgi:hypothetical protein
VAKPLHDDLVAEVAIDQVSVWRQEDTAYAAYRGSDAEMGLLLQQSEQMRQTGLDLGGPLRRAIANLT